MRRSNLSATVFFLTKVSLSPFLLQQFVYRPRLTLRPHRAILYCPFVPFSILFSRAVQLLDTAELARLDRFATSLQSGTNPPEEITHPYRLYQLLCQAARLYFDLDHTQRPADSTMIHHRTDPWAEVEFAQSGLVAEATADEMLVGDILRSRGLYDWSYDSQQFMGLLNDDVTF